MNKPYLLIAGDNYYPSADTGDWVGCFSTYEEAKAQVEPRKTNGYTVNVRDWGKTNGYTVNVRDWGCDWYEIIDLREWTE